MVCRPVLLRINDKDKGKQPESPSTQGITPLPSTTTSPASPPHKDEGQVKLDVNRSFVSFPKSQSSGSKVQPEFEIDDSVDISSQEKDKLRLELELVIVTILRRHPSLNYFQGYHDVSSNILVLLDCG